VDIIVFPHIQFAYLKSHVGIAFKVPTYSVEQGHNVDIIVFPHIQCASLNCHGDITFIFSINIVVC
jgi:hypothetical protein